MNERILRFPALPDYLTIYHYIDGGSQRVRVESTIHVNRAVVLPQSWSLDYPFHKLTQAAKVIVIERYGLTLSPQVYS